MKPVFSKKWEREMFYALVTHPYGLQATDELWIIGWRAHVLGSVGWAMALIGLATEIQDRRAKARERT